MKTYIRTLLAGCLGVFVFYIIGWSLISSGLSTTHAQTAEKYRTFATFSTDREFDKLEIGYKKYKSKKAEILKEATTCLPGGSLNLKYLGYNWVQFSLFNRNYMARIVSGKIEAITLM